MELSGTNSSSQPGLLQDGSRAELHGSATLSASPALPNPSRSTARVETVFQPLLCCVSRGELTNQSSSFPRSVLPLQPLGEH
ncbi:hypothetical protein COCON_G00186330 [Conger conger]|uniref:Uncharacterized protein n=1 Tax=Conger conger TaxID=82655 RepID=A0A9Q1D2M4_CONCO|nr:hypothetical protein COCON_G00186330 [Conger conger]